MARYHTRRSALTSGPVEVIAFDQDNRRALSSEQILLVDNAINKATDTIRLKAIFTNDDEKLWPDEFVNARLLIETLHDVLAVPSTAAQRGPQGLFVWIVTPEDTAEPRPIKTGPTAGDLTAITSDVGDGERVATHGQYKLKRNVLVTVASPSLPVVGGFK